MNSNDFKGGYIESSTLFTVYSYATPVNAVQTISQLVYRPDNRIERNITTFTATSAIPSWVNPVDWNCSYINLCSPYFSPVNTNSNNAGDFMCTSEVTDDYSITLRKFSGTYESKVVSEVVYLDGAMALPVFGNNTNFYRGSFRGNR